MSKERDDLIKRTKMARAAITFDKVTSKVINVLIILAFIFIAAALLDMLHFAAKGVKGVEFKDFNTLLKENPDTVAWLKMDGTHINHPVVQGKDNFEYLDLDFYGKYYAGGSLFLDYQNTKDFSDDYNLIHGHHMVGGAMFGDLANYMDEDFFSKNNTGVLLTPSKNYRLKVVASGSANAYDLRLYNVKADKDLHLESIDRLTGPKIDMDLKDEKLLVLSTCTGDLNDTRTVVVCTMEYDPDLKTVID